MILAVTAHQPQGQPTPGHPALSALVPEGANEPATDAPMPAEFVQEDDPRWIPVKEVAERLGTSLSYTYTLIYKGQLPVRGRRHALRVDSTALGNPQPCACGRCDITVRSPVTPFAPGHQWKVPANLEGRTTPQAECIGQNCTRLINRKRSRYCSRRCANPRKRLTPKGELGEYLLAELAAYEKRGGTLHGLAREIGISPSSYKGLITNGNRHLADKTIAALQRFFKDLPPLKSYHEILEERQLKVIHERQQERQARLDAGEPPEDGWSRAAEKISRTRRATNQQRREEERLVRERYEREGRQEDADWLQAREDERQKLLNRQQTAREAHPDYKRNTRALAELPRTLPHRVVVSFTRRLAPRRKAGEPDPTPTPEERKRWSTDIAERLKQRPEYSWVTPTIVLGIWDEHQAKKGQASKGRGRDRLAHRLPIIDTVLANHGLSRTSPRIPSKVWEEALSRIHKQEQAMKTAMGKPLTTTEDAETLRKWWFSQPSIRAVRPKSVRKSTESAPELSGN
jgi:hypothetical protein